MVFTLTSLFLCFRVHTSNYIVIKRLTSASSPFCLFSFLLFLLKVGCAARNGGGDISHLQFYTVKIIWIHLTINLC